MYEGFREFEVATDYECWVGDSEKIKKNIFLCEGDNNIDMYAWSHGEEYYDLEALKEAIHNE